MTRAGQAERAHALAELPMSAAVRMKDSATKSAPSSAAISMSATSFSVIAGSSGCA